MKQSNNNDVNTICTNHNNRKPPKKTKFNNIILRFSLTVSICLIEFAYLFLLLFIRENIFKISLIPNIIKSCFILIYFIFSILISVLEKIRISYDTNQYLYIEKIISLIILFSSLIIVSISISGCTYYYIYTKINSSCLYNNYCELQIKPGHSVGYTCNYKANEVNSKYFKSCKIYSKDIYQLPPKNLQNCGVLYYCELMSNNLDYKDKKDNWSCITCYIVLGLILIIFWFITLILSFIKTLLLMKMKNVKKKKTEFTLNLKSDADKYRLVLCEHNNIKNNFCFYLDDLKFRECKQHIDDNSNNSINSSSQPMKVSIKKEVLETNYGTLRNLTSTEN